MPAKDFDALGMECRNQRLVALFAEQRTDPLLHFGGGFVRKGDRENAAGDNAMFDEIRDAKGDDAGLAATGASEDEERPLERVDGVLLGGIESVRHGRGSLCDLWLTVDKSLQSILEYYNVKIKKETNMKSGEFEVG